MQSSPGFTASSAFSITRLPLTLAIQSPAGLGETPLQSSPGFTTSLALLDSITSDPSYPVTFWARQRCPCSSLQASPPPQPSAPWPACSGPRPRCLSPMPGHRNATQPQGAGAPGGWDHPCVSTNTNDRNTTGSFNEVEPRCTKHGCLASKCHTASGGRYTGRCRRLGPSLRVV